MFQSHLHIITSNHKINHIFLQGEYESLAKNLSNYVVKLLDHVRGNDELDIILNEEGDVPDLQEHGKLSRLKLALKFNEKHVSILWIISHDRNLQFQVIAVMTVSILL